MKKDTSATPKRRPPGNSRVTRPAISPRRVTLKKSRLPEAAPAQEMTIDRMALDGEGQGILNGKNAFVFNALPGERVRVRILESKREVLWAQATEVLSASTDRVAPRCTAYGICSGCNLMHLSYPVQLIYKNSLVERALQQIGGFSPVRTASCIASPEEFAYRNKVQTPLRSIGGKIRMGFFRRNIREVIPLEHCPVHCPEGDLVYGEIGRLLLEKKVPVYDEKDRSGSLRHILVRTARNRGESLVCLVTAEKHQEKLLQPLATELMARIPSVKGVVGNLNRSTGNLILGRDTFPIAGSTFVTEEIEGCLFKITAPSFFQVNTHQIPAMYHTIRKCLKESVKGKIVDAYSGVGVFSLLLSRAAHEIVGIEAIADAVRDSRENAALNRAGNVRFLKGQVETVLPQINHADGIILNPPRAGCLPEVLATLLRILPGRIVYVSCNPASLARDLKILAKKYRLETVQPIDMFPQTGHVETVAGLHLR